MMLSKMFLLRSTALALALAPAITVAKPASTASRQTQELRELRAQVQALTARLDALQVVQATVQAQAADAQAKATEVAEDAQATQAQVTAQAEAMPDQVKMALANAVKPGETTIARFRGAPEFATSDGWRFKVRGRINYDAAYIENPGNSIATKDLGFATRMRRIRLGVEGGMPGGFDYKAEVDFADSIVRPADVVLTWRGGTETARSPIEVSIGHFEPLDGFEQISSSRYTSFVERAAFNEAFNNVRRLGGTIAYISPGDELRVTAGVFNDTINADRANDDYMVSGRATWAPKAFGGQLHFGANAQFRHYQSNDLAVAYRARPFTNGTNTRFVDAGNLALRSDTIIGAEFIGIFGPFHVAAEAQRLTAHTLRPGDALSGGDLSTGRRTNGDPQFFGMHAEVGYILTGETRGYKDGLWARTKVKNPLGRGGSGAWSVNLRYDRLDLTDQVGAAGSLTAADFVDGGRQSGYLAALVWQPMDYVRFTLEYTRGVVTGGPLQAAVNPGSSLPLSDRSFNFNMGSMRAAWDF